ncbi:MAG: hypothetical protein WCQ76_05145 [Fusobacterium sp.]
MSISDFKNSYYSMINPSKALLNKEGLELLINLIFNNIKASSIETMTEEDVVDAISEIKEVGNFEDTEIKYSLSDEDISSIIKERRNDEIIK